MLIVTQTRQTVLQRMGEKATERGANAIAACRFDTGEIASLSEVCCYGSAAIVVPIPEGARVATPPPAADAEARAQLTR